MNNLKEICIKYFDTWSRKDIDGLAALFANEVQLQDWEMMAGGMYRVLEANQKIFDQFSGLSVNVQNIYQDSEYPHRVICQIGIEFNGGESSLNVIDVINFDDDGKISLIWAYKG